MASFLILLISFQRSIPKRTTTSMSSRLYSSSIVDPNILARAWTPRIVDDSEQQHHRSSTTTALTKAVARTIPLLSDESAVPFICRYRVDVIQPLSTRQVHALQSLTAAHAKLDPLRNKLLQALAPQQEKNKKNDDELILKIKTSTSKSELDDWYAPFKPPSKGSILERIRTEHPQLVEQVDAFWANDASSTDNDINWTKFKPHDALVHLLSTKISSEPTVMEKVLEELRKHGRVTTKFATAAAVSDEEQRRKYQTYEDFGAFLSRIRDHQVLAIRRGVDQKVLKLAYDIDGSKMEGGIRYQLRQVLRNHRRALPSALAEEAVHDAWTRVLRRKGTGRLWGDAVRRAQERSMQVFCDNTSRALLAPPPQLTAKASSSNNNNNNNNNNKKNGRSSQTTTTTTTGLLSVDPGFQAGLKCALLDGNGKVVGPLKTVKYMSDQQRARGLQEMKELLQSATKLSTTDKVVVTLGNGHGSQAAKELVQTAAEEAAVAIDVQLVNEAGASVWSVTEQAQEEFPNDPPSAIAAVSIGRRWQNPLHELVKIPPMSLGLGMYQHDLSKQDLERELHRVSVDAVAQVGVDVNACRIEILRKVPGLASLGDSILKSRPLATRNDLLNVPRLGPKTFEACAGFLRISDGPEALDGTLVHPESYDIARWLLQKLGWDLNSVPSDIPARTAWADEWSDVLEEGASKFGVTSERVLAVVGNLYDSIARVDPRVDNTSASSSTNGGTAATSCKRLPDSLADDAEALAQACPLRGIAGTVRNLADFGAFIDFGGFSDGLLHVSKLGGRDISTLLIGEEIGVDILQVQGKRVSLGLAGKNQVATTRTRKPLETSGAARPTKRRKKS